MNEVEWRRLRNLIAREIVSALIRGGFVLYNQRGSHQRYEHGDGGRVAVTFHRPGEYLSDRHTSLDDRASGEVGGGRSPRPLSHSLT